MNSSAQPNSKNTVETVLTMLLLLLLLYSLYVVLQVFFGVFAYALIFSVSFAGVFEKFARLLGNRKKLAATIYCLLIIGLLAQPIIYLVHSITDFVGVARDWITQVRTNGVPPLSQKIAGLPMIGGKISAFWEKLSQNPKETIGIYESEISAMVKRLFSGGAGMVGAILEFVVGVIISALFMVNSKAVLKPVKAFLSYMFGEVDGPALLDAAGKAIRGVAIGVMGTAMIAGVAAYIGFLIAGIPFAMLWAAVIFFMVVIQVGPLPALIPIVIWVFVKDTTGWGIFMIVWSVLLVFIDNVLKPILIGRSAKLPVLVLFLGVIGGMVAWGFTGMFKGAIILALFYTIFTSWLHRRAGTSEVTA